MFLASPLPKPPARFYLGCRGEEFPIAAGSFSFIFAQQLMTRQQTLDLYFLDARHKLVELAAFLDRVERAEGKDDFRLHAFRTALAKLEGKRKNKAKDVLLAFSDPTKKPIAAATTKAACGACRTRNRWNLMFRLLKRRKAIKSFVFKLPLELHRRCGEKRYYSFGEVNRLLDDEKYDRAFSAYAYALFCSRKDFDAYFSALRVNCTYDGLRKFVARKYFKGIIDFDAAAIIRFARGVGDKSYYESGLGDSASNSTSSSGHH